MKGSPRLEDRGCDTVLLGQGPALMMMMIRRRQGKEVGQMPRPVVLRPPRI
jgi:hypothetical protein